MRVGRAGRVRHTERTERTCGRSRRLHPTAPAVRQRGEDARRTSPPRRKAAEQDANLAEKWTSGNQADSPSLRDLRVCRGSEL